MSEKIWITPRGEAFDDSASFRPRARVLADLLKAGEIPFARLISLSKTEDADVVTLEVDVELVQDRAYDIRPQERISAEFPHNDNHPPEVLALRHSFPAVPHLNLRDAELPRSLCLFEEPWHEIRPWWTPGYFIRVLRNWLAATARDELHGNDQPLEPLLLGTGFPLIVPGNLWVGEGPTRLDVIRIQTPEMGRPVLVAHRPEDLQGPSQEHGVHFLATVLVGKPQEHGVVRRTPRTLGDLRALLSTAKLDLIDVLTYRLKEWRENRDFLDRKPILIAVLPKLRERGGAVEATDVFAFLVTGETVATLGEKLGLWEMKDDFAAMLIPSQDPNPDTVEVVCLHPVSELSMETAAQAAGRVRDLRNFAAIGQGALGSQVVSNLLRTGFGSWTLVDKDMLLPHNLARHALLGRAWGFPKAQSMAAALTNTVHDSLTRALVCDVLEPGDKAEDLAASLNEAEIVFDFSASTAVARHLAGDTSSNARRLSLFLNPSGRHLVLLAEDTNRGVRLDELEAQFYRLVVRTEALRGFFQERPESLRYGGSCADISMHIPQDRVALHAGIAAGALQQLQAGAIISVWQLTDDLSVDHFRVEGLRCCWFKQEGWKVGIDTDLVTHLLSLRSQHLPSETGGILVGTVDTHRKWVLLVDVVPAPPDSEQWPTGFIRGSVGLCREVKRIQEWTGHSVHYVGEWHSHPPGKSLGMSSDDRHVLDYVAKYMRADGLPGIILIVGETGVQCHINVSLKPRSVGAYA